MLTLRKANERGTSQLGWLDSQHSFSFANYLDYQHMGFGTLRVINEDKVSPGAGFGTHSHRDMEIISYVIDGELAHRDSMGNGSVIRPGDVQRMTAGTGVSHSEMNASDQQPVHFLQIWIVPSKAGLTPGYEQTFFAPAERQDHWRLVGSQTGREGSVTIHQDVDLYAATLKEGTELTYDLAAGRQAWLQVATGSLTVNGQPLSAGDGAALSAVSTLSVTGTAENSEILLFDLAA